MSESRASRLRSVALWNTTLVRSINVYYIDQSGNCGYGSAILFDLLGLSYAAPGTGWFQAKQGVLYSALGRWWRTWTYAHGAVLWFIDLSDWIIHCVWISGRALIRHQAINSSWLIKLRPAILPVISHSTPVPIIWMMQSGMMQWHEKWCNDIRSDAIHLPVADNHDTN